jgi:cysteinyl-tRNA synthetase
MSKSLNNFYTLRDILGMGYAPEVVRYLLASVPYRKKLNFTFDGLTAAATSIERLRNFQLRLETSQFPAGLNEKLAGRGAEALEIFGHSLDDDLNTAEALAAVFDYIRDANTVMDAGEFRSGNAENARNVLQQLDGIFDVLQPTVSNDSIGAEEVETLIAERVQAKKTRNFARADEIRQQLLERGIILEDTKEGSRWKRK